MRKTLLYITILIFFYCCKNGETQTDGKNKESSIESVDLISRTKTDSIKYESDLKTSSYFKKSKILQTVYVTAKSGLVYREKPNLESKKIGTFEYGQKLGVIEKTQIALEIVDNNKRINGKWYKVIRNGNYSSQRDYSLNTGYVFSGFLIDSTKADIKKFPVWANYKQLNSIKIREEKNNKLNLSIRKITKKEFLNYKSNYTNSIIKDSTIKAYPNKPFILKTDSLSYKFRCRDTPCFSYEGYIKNLNSYVIGMLGPGIGEVFLVDKKTGNGMILTSPYDGSNFEPLLSKNNNKIIFYSSCPEGKNCSKYYNSASYIAIYDIKGINDLSKIRSYRTFDTYDWVIDDLCWIDDNTIAIRIFDEIKFDKKGQDYKENLRYIKVKIE